MTNYVKISWNKDHEVSLPCIWSSSSIYKMKEWEDGKKDTSGLFCNRESAILVPQPGL